MHIIVTWFVALEPCDGARAVPAEELGLEPPEHVTEWLELQRKFGGEEHATVLVTTRKDHGLPAGTYYDFHGTVTEAEAAHVTRAIEALETAAQPLQ